MPKKRQLVIGPAGLQKWANVEDLGNLPEGFRPASADEARQVHLDEKFGGVGAKAAAFGHGLGSSATLGLLDVGLTEGAGLIGGEDAKARMQASINEMREGAPGAHFAGEMGGLLLGTVGSVGKVAAKGAIGKGLAATPAALAMRGGGALERALLKKGVGRGGAMAARAGAEGAAFEAGHLVSESALGNAELTGESLLAAMGGGAVFGGLTAGGLHFGGRAIEGALGRGKNALQKAITRPGAKGYQALATDSFGHEAPGLGKRVADMMGDAASVPSGAQADDIATLLASKEARRDAVYGVQAARDEATEGLTRHVGDAMDASNVVQESFQRTGFKPSFVAKQIRRGNVFEQRQVSAGFLDHVGGTLDDMIDVQGKNVYGRIGELKKLRGRLGEYQKEFSAAIGAEDEAVRHYLLMDRLKAEFGAEAAAATRASSKKVVNRNTAKMLQSVHDDALKPALEMTDTWGEIANSQARINKQWHRTILSGDEFNPKFARWEKTKWGAKQARVSSDKVGSHVRGLTDPAKSDSHRALTEHLDNLKSLSDEMGDALELTTEQATAKAKLDAAVIAAQDQVERTTKTVTHANQLDAIDEATRRGPGAMLGGIAAGGLGAYGLSEGDPTLMAAAVAAGAVMRPGMVIRQLAALEKLTGGVQGKLSGKLGGLFGRAVKGAPVGVARAAGYFETETDRRRVAKDKREQYEMRAQQVRAQEPAQVSNATKAELAPVADAAPNTVASMANAAARAQAYLAAQLPRDGVPGAVMGPPPEASAMEVDKWLRKLAAVEDPASILDDLTDGKLSRDSVEAVKAVYPALYEQMRGDVMGRINDMQAEGKQLPYRERIDLGTLLDLPTDPMLRPDVMASIQASYAQQQQPQATPEKRVPDLAGAYATESEQTEKDV